MKKTLTSIASALLLLGMMSAAHAGVYALRIPVKGMVPSAATTPSQSQSSGSGSPVSVSGSPSANTPGMLSATAASSLVSKVVFTNTSGMVLHLDYWPTGSLQYPFTHTPE